MIKFVVDDTIDCPSQSIDDDSRSQSMDIDLPQSRLEKSIEIETSALSSSESEEDSDDHPIRINHIQVTFTIPYSISNDSILNETVFIIDLTHNQLIQTLISICINQSSFHIDYFTNVSLPHNVCLYLLLNMTNSKEIFLCRTIQKKFSSMHDDHDDDHHEMDHISNVPGVIFVVIQSVIILIMMLIISMVYTVKNRRSVGTTRRVTNVIISEEDFILSPIEEQVLAATDLTTIHKDHIFTNHNLNNIKKLTKRSIESSEDVEDTYL
jgi:hypothetical protein